jgi:hypothetical protein
VRSRVVYTHKKISQDYQNALEGIKEKTQKFMTVEEGTLSNENPSNPSMVSLGHQGLSNNVVLKS